DRRFFLPCMREGNPTCGKFRNELSHQGGPACLMAGPESVACISVEIFIEQQELFIPGLLVKPVVSPVQGSVAGLILFEKADHPFGEAVCNGLQGELFTRTGRIFYLQPFPIEFPVLTDGPDDEVVDRYPNRSTPVRIAAEKVGGTVPRIVFDVIIGAA